MNSYLVKNISIAVIILFTAINSFAQKKNNLEGIEVGMIAPEIVLPDYSGETICLSDTRGKIVLINFWASWCSPCRKKSPDLLNIYNDYSLSQFKSGETGFVLFNVSLDRNEDAWTRSIIADKMDKTINVGDMTGWKNSAASSYNIKSIPSNVLIDGEGKVLAINLSIKDLKKKLRKLKKR
jgi:thiol-disulfide isomerase/thioredoxin